MPLVEQVMLNLSDHLMSLQVFVGIHIAKALCVWVLSYFPYHYVLHEIISYFCIYIVYVNRIWYLFSRLYHVLSLWRLFRIVLPFWFSILFADISYSMEFKYSFHISHKKNTCWYWRSTSGRLQCFTSFDMIVWQIMIYMLRISISFFPRDPVKIAWTLSILWHFSSASFWLQKRFIFYLCKAVALWKMNIFIHTVHIHTKLLLARSMSF